MSRVGWRLIPALAAVAALSLGAALAASAHPARGHHRGHLRGAAARQQALLAYLRAHRGAHAAGAGIGNDSGLGAEAVQIANERLAPAGYVSGAALATAVRAGSLLPESGGSWQDVTTLPYNAQPGDYTDPFWGNQGAGFSLVGGRVTALVASPDGFWYAGTADGGIWRSGDQGGHWTPIFDQMPSLSIGALAIDPVDNSLWVGTGEANTSQDSYAGTGIYRAAAGSTNFQLVGGGGYAENPIVGKTVFKIAFDESGNAYAGTNNGLFRYDAGTGRWTEVLNPVPDAFPPYPNQVTSVQVVPGTHGEDVIAAVAWRSADLPTNGFYESTDGGHTFTMVTPTGAINAADIGRTTFAYSADGSRLYAIVQSPSALVAAAPSNLQGVFVSTGSPARVGGPWTLIADPAILSAAGSANAYGPNSAGAQAWYNQDLAVDPNNPNHVYMGLEEVFESSDGGATWDTASPYWNYPFPCDATTPPTCPNTTHPDQHAMMIAGDQIVIGNDGGVYSRSLSDTGTGNWNDLNASLGNLQYYDARTAEIPGGGTSVIGGLQDNGTSILDTGFKQMLEPAGGDGFDVYVDQANSNDWIGEYAYGAMYATTDGGHSFYNDVTPGCAGQATVLETPFSNCDPGMRFWTPIAPDASDPGTLVTGGEFVWVSHKGVGTSCTSATTCDWTNVFDTGTGNAVTALASTGGGSVIYAAWVGGGGNPGPTFASGIATNYGGTWHQLNVSSLPNRYIAGMTVDPSNPAHVYAIYNGYSRRWIPGGGIGHVFESDNGGKTWTNISGNLPDIASDALVLRHGRLALATDAGVFTARVGQHERTFWSRLGTGLPNAAVDDLTVGPAGYIYAATHGRGIWRIGF